MNNRITYALRYGNHDVSIHVVVDLKLFFGIVDKTFNNLNVFNQRRDRNFYGFHQNNSALVVSILLFISEAQEPQDNGLNGPRLAKLRHFLVCFAILC